MTQTEASTRTPNQQNQTPLQQELARVDAKVSFSIEQAIAESRAVEDQQRGRKPALNVDKLPTLGGLKNKETDALLAGVEVGDATKAAEQARQAKVQVDAVEQVAAATTSVETLAALEHVGADEDEVSEGQPSVAVAETTTTSPVDTDPTHVADAESVAVAPTTHKEIQTVSREVEVPATADDLFKMSPLEQIAFFAKITNLPVVLESNADSSQILSNIKMNIQSNVGMIVPSEINTRLGRNIADVLAEKFDQMSKTVEADQFFTADYVRSVIEQQQRNFGGNSLLLDENSDAIKEKSELIANYLNENLVKSRNVMTITNAPIIIRVASREITKRVYENDMTLKDDAKVRGVGFIRQVLTQIISGDANVTDLNSFAAQVADIAASNEQTEAGKKSARAVYGNMARNVLMDMVAQLPPKHETQEFQEEVDVEDEVDSPAVDVASSDADDEIIEPVIDTDDSPAETLTQGKASPADQTETEAVAQETGAAETPEQKAERFQKKLDGFKQAYKELVEKTDDPIMRRFEMLAPGTELMINLIPVANKVIDKATGIGYEGVPKNETADQPYTDSEIRLQLTETIFRNLKDEDGFKKIFKDNPNEIVSLFNEFMDKVFGPDSTTKDRKTGIFNLTTGKIVRPGVDGQLYERMADQLKVPKAEEEKRGRNRLWQRITYVFNGIRYRGKAQETVVEDGGNTESVVTETTSKTAEQLNQEFKKDYDPNWMQDQIFEKMNKLQLEVAKVKADGDEDIKNLYLSAVKEQQNELDSLLVLVVAAKNLDSASPEKITKMRELATKLGVANNEKNQAILDAQVESAHQAVEAVQKATETAIADIEASNLPDAQKTKLRRNLQRLAVALTAGVGTFGLTSLGGDFGLPASLIASIGFGGLAVWPENSFGYVTAATETTGFAWEKKLPNRLKFVGTFLRKTASSMQSWRKQGYFGYAALGAIVGTALGAFTQNYQPSGGENSSGVSEPLADSDSGQRVELQHTDDSSGYEGLSGTGGDQSGGASMPETPIRNSTEGVEPEQIVQSGDQNDGASLRPGQSGPNERAQYDGDQSGGASMPTTPAGTEANTTPKGFGQRAEFGAEPPTIEVTPQEPPTVEVTPQVTQITADITSTNTEPTLWKEIESDLKNIPGIDAQTSMNGVDLARPLIEGADPNLLPVNAIKNLSRILTEAAQFGGSDYSVWNDFSKFDTSHIANASNLDNLRLLSGPITVESTVMKSIVKHLPDALSNTPSGNIPTEVQSVLQHLAYGDWMQLPVRIDASTAADIEKAIKWLSVN